MFEEGSVVIVVIGIILFVASEVLPFVKSVKANSILQGIVSFLAGIKKALVKPKPPA